MRGTEKAPRATFFVLAVALTLTTTAGAQVRRTQMRVEPRPVDPAITFLAPYGLNNFSQHYVEALSALLRAQEEYDAGRHGDGAARL